MKHITSMVPRFVVAGVLALSLASVPGVASAASGPTCHAGAANMLNAWGVGANGGMENAMNANGGWDPLSKGNVGMFNAITKSEAGC